MDKIKDRCSLVTTYKSINVIKFPSHATHLYNKELEHTLLGSTTRIKLTRENTLNLLK